MIPSSQYFLGADIGGTKTHALITDETGQTVGFGESGPGNHESVGYDGLAKVLRIAFSQALAEAKISPAQIAGAGFGVAGYDWSSERVITLQAIGALGLSAPLEAVNDTILGLLAGSADGWGVAVVSGTGCNCWGWDRTRQRIGRVTGGGSSMGEGAGASELMSLAVQAVARAWTRRSPATALTQAFIRHTGARDHENLLEGLMNGYYDLEASAAPLVFQCAELGDAVALELVRWAGCELGELANAVIRQLEFENLAFDVVQVGSLYRGGALLTGSMEQTIHALAPKARLVPLTIPPVVGAVMLGMEQAGLQPTANVRQNIAETLHRVRVLDPMNGL